MRDNLAGFSISVAVHVLIIGAFLLLPAERFGKTKSMVIDFTIENGAGVGNTAERVGGGAAGYRLLDMGGKSAAEKRPKDKEQKAENSESPKDVMHIQASVKIAHGQAGHYSDPQGQTVVHGNPGTGGNVDGVQGGHGKDKGIHGAGGGAGTGRVLDYGRGGAAERNFAFIRENIMRNIRYPERARKMGWEGRVVLSFAVLEDGTVQELKVINSSGFKSLDENAKEAVLRTTFSHKIPYRLTVLLPVEYRLE